MSEFIDRFLDLPARQRALATVGLLLLVGLVYATYFYLPIRGEIAAKRERLARLERERETKKKLVSNLDEMRRVVAELNGALREAAAQLPDKKEIPDLLSSVSSRGREAGLEILVFRQRPEVYQDFYAEVPVEIQVEGAYHQIRMFLDKVGALNRIVNVSDISIRQPRVQGDAVVVQASCSATTFRFLDEAERERVAREREKDRQKGGAR